MKRKYTLHHDNLKNIWVLKHDETEAVVRTFKSKKDGLKAGVLKKILGRQGGSVVLRTKAGLYETERYFPDTR